MYTARDARQGMARIGAIARGFTYADVAKGMNVESEHGSRDPLTDVTHDDVLLTLRIALAHLYERADYYTLLEKYVETDRDARNNPDDLQPIATYSVSHSRYLDTERFSYALQDPQFADPRWHAARVDLYLDSSEGQSGRNKVQLELLTPSSMSICGEILADAPRAACEAAFRSAAWLLHAPYVDHPGAQHGVDDLLLVRFPFAHYVVLDEAQNSPDLELRSLPIRRSPFKRSTRLYVSIASHNPERIEQLGRALDTPVRSHAILSDGRHFGALLLFVKDSP